MPSRVYPFCVDLYYRLINQRITSHTTHTKDTADLTTRVLIHLSCVDFDRSSIENNPVSRETYIYIYITAQNPTQLIIFKFHNDRPVNAIHNHQWIIHIVSLFISGYMRISIKSCGFPSPVVNCCCLQSMLLFLTSFMVVMVSSITEIVPCISNMMFHYLSKLCSDIYISVAPV